MVANQTAMEQFIEWIDSDCTPMNCVMKAKELLKVEREQRENLQNDTTLKEKLFNLANEFAVAKKGDIAVLLHSIHNKLD